MTDQSQWDLIVLGAGASGLMCAATAGKRGRRVLVLDHARRAGEKIRVSGGGRCNFTHLESQPERYLGTDPDFPRAALNAYTPRDFLALLARHRVAYREKAPGQLFCDGSAETIVAVLLEECRRARVTIAPGTGIRQVERVDERFVVTTAKGAERGAALVVALGGRSMPKLGATGLGHAIARQFGLKITPLRPGLCPLTFNGPWLEACRDWSGISLPVSIASPRARFADDLLFTHRGLSGPAILQISSHWLPGEPLDIDLAPGIDLAARLLKAKQTESRVLPRTVLSRFLPKRLACRKMEMPEVEVPLAGVGDKVLRELADTFHHWRVVPVGTGGFERAEVTVGGVDTRAIDPVTMGCRTVPGLFFVGEVLDVTGWLGGYNLQWAWSSGHAAGRAA